MNRCLIAIAVSLAGAGCSTLPPSASVIQAGGIGCETDQAAIFFDFEGAPPSACSVDGRRAFTVYITPEHAPPINPSPWYAFRYQGQGEVTVRLSYDGAGHRYSPKLLRDGEYSTLPVTLRRDDSEARMILPAGEGRVSAQPLLGEAYYSRQMASLAQMDNARVFQIGSSREGRPIEAVHFGDINARQLIVLLGRQHPPEVTGAYAMGPFVQRLAARLMSDPTAAGRFQILAVPFLNPDGVAHGHWRANLGETDLNRDWGKFTQPETSGVKAWLDALPAGTKPAVMIDFHSTGRNLFYVQGDDAPADQQAFLNDWLGGKEDRFDGYPFSIERRNANPGSGTSKNWFHATYDIPAYTYEVGDKTGEIPARLAAENLAESLADVLIAQRR